MIRKHTDPGLAPPAPGSVCPPSPPLTRSLTPGAGKYTSEDDVPTRPDGNLDPDLLKLVRIVSDMPPVNKRRFVRMVEAYSKLSLDDRVLAEEMTCALARERRIT